jgi:hypothetical protein
MGGAVLRLHEIAPRHVEIAGEDIAATVKQKSRTGSRELYLSYPTMCRDGSVDTM